MAKLKTTPAAFSTYAKPLIGNPKQEEDIFDWIMQQREAEIVVSTSSIVARMNSVLILKTEIETSYTIGYIRLSRDGI